MHAHSQPMCAWFKNTHTLLLFVLAYQSNMFHTLCFLLLLRVVTRYSYVLLLIQVTHFLLL